MDRTALLSLLPHQGPALWLDCLIDHDARRISGLTDWAYLDAFGPTSSPCLLFEAAAQLCAAHGALYGTDKSIDAAFVGKISSVRLHAEPEARTGALQVSAEQEAVSPAGAQYGFAIHRDRQLLIDGRLLLVLGHA